MMRDRIGHRTREDATGGGHQPPPVNHDTPTREQPHDGGVDCAAEAAAALVARGGGGGRGGGGESKSSSPPPSPPPSPAPFFRLRYTLEDVDGVPRQFTRAELEQGLHTRRRQDLLEEEDGEGEREHCSRVDQENETPNVDGEGGKGAGTSKEQGTGDGTSLADAELGVGATLSGETDGVRLDAEQEPRGGSNDEDTGRGGPTAEGTGGGGGTDPEFDAALDDGGYEEEKQLNSEAEEERSAVAGRKSAVHCDGDGSKVLFEPGTNLDVYGRDGTPHLGVVVYGEAGTQTVHFSNGDVEHGLKLSSERVKLRPSSNVLEERFGGEMDRIVELDQNGQHLDARIARMILAVQVNGGKTPVGHPLQQINRLLHTERHERRRKAAACKRALALSTPKSRKAKNTAKKRSPASKSRSTPLGNRGNFSNADGDDWDDDSASASSPAPKRQRSDDSAPPTPRQRHQKRMSDARQRVKQKSIERSNRSKSPPSPQCSPTARRRLFDEGASDAARMDVDDEATETTGGSQMDVDDGVDEMAATTEESSASDVATSDNGTWGTMCRECKTCCGRASPHGCTSSGAASPPRRVRTRSMSGASKRRDEEPAADDGGGDDHSCEGEEAVERTALHPAAAPINPADPLHEESKFEALIEFMRDAVLKEKLSDPSFRASVKQGLSGLPPRVAGVVEMLLLETKHHASSGDESSDGSSESDDNSESDDSRGSESDESDDDESGEDDDASVDSSDDGIDEETFHTNEFERVPDRFILQSAVQYKINNNHYKLMPGYCYFEQVCLKYLKEYERRGWNEGLGKEIFDDLKADGFVFMAVGADNRYVPLEEPGPEIVSEMDLIAWAKPRGSAQRDKASYRSAVYYKLYRLSKGDAKRQVKADEAARIESDFEDAQDSSPSLGIFEHDPDSYTPHPLDPSLPADVSEEDESFEQFQEEKAEEMESSSTTSAPRSCLCRGECDYKSCGLDSTWKVVFQHADFFEHVLELEERNERPDLGKLLAFIEECKFECFASMDSEEILHSLLNINTKDKSGRRHETFQGRWNAGGSWRPMFGDIVYGVQRRLCGKCYCCGREVGEYCKGSHLFGFHGDHLLEFWWKKERCSRLRESIACMLLESLKTRLVCGFCHENGDIPGYEEHLRYVPKLTYDLSNGVTHRTAAQALELREMKCFILELKSRGAFFTGNKPKMSWKTLEFLVWKYFRVVLSDVTYFTEADWTTTNNPQNRGRRLINSIIMNLLKMLGVTCDGEDCDEDFCKYNPARMSGIHMDHRGRKKKNPSDAVKYHIDVLIEELKRGRCNPLCCFCHGVETF